MSLVRPSAYGFVLSIGISVTAWAQTPIFTNRTPDAAKINAVTPSAEKAPKPALAPSDADPALFRPDERPKGLVETQPDQAYYVYLRNVTRVLVSDSHGQVDDVFDARSAHKIRSATYHFMASDAVYIIVPVKEKYSVTFETAEAVRFLEIVKGRGNASPDEAIRYRDLDLDGSKAKFEITPAGVGPLRLDRTALGRFDSIIEPTVNLHGPAAKDTRGPELSIKVLERTATSILIAIDARDTESGLKSVNYAIGRNNSSGYRAFPYDGPLRIDLTRASFIMAYADDYAGNRSGRIFEFNSQTK